MAPDSVAPRLSQPRWWPESWDSKWWSSCTTRYGSFGRLRPSAVPSPPCSVLTIGSTSMGWNWSRQEGSGKWYSTRFGQCLGIEGVKVVNRMRQRFDGHRGRPFLVEALQLQPIVGGDAVLAEAIAESSVVASYDSGASIIEESASDNDLYFILAGVASIRVSGREIAVRTASQHVGEMALLDPGQPRSAAAVADGEVVAARISAGTLAELADANPMLWRNVARVLSERLRQRNRFVPPANPRPVLFVGCSVEALPIGRAIQSSLEHDPILVRVWTDDTFKASHFPVESLERELTKVDFAALVLSPDDTVTSRDSTEEAPRDNLVFELGLFMGALGHSRTFLLHPRGSGIKIPTDLLGFTPLTYQTSSDGPTSVSVASACEDIRSAILASGPR